MDEYEKELFNRALDTRIQYSSIDEVEEILIRGREEEDQDIHELLEDAYTAAQRSVQLVDEKLNHEDEGGSELPIGQITKAWSEHEDILMRYVGQTFGVSEDYRGLREQIEGERVKTEVPIPRFMMRRYDSEVGDAEIID
jgi:tRNA(Glu) U13 pseudouridine synthase TruD